MKLAAVNVTVVSSVPLTAIAESTGASLSAVSLITRLAVVVAVPSPTVTVKVSVVVALRALIAAALGVKLYAPLAVVTASVPYVPTLVATPLDAVSPLIPYVNVVPASTSAPTKVPVIVAKVPAGPVST